MAAWTYHVTSKEVENHIFKHDWLITHLCMHKQLTFTKQWKYFCANISYIVTSDTLLASFWDVFFLTLALTFSEFHVNPRRKDSVPEKRYRICVSDETFWLHALLSMSFFVAVFVYSLPLPKWRAYSMAVCWCSMWWYHE